MSHLIANKEELFNFSVQKITKKLCNKKRKMNQINIFCNHYFIAAQQQKKEKKKQKHALN